jgi:hypothetical protein
LPMPEKAFLGLSAPFFLSVFEKEFELSALVFHVKSCVK